MASAAANLTIDASWLASPIIATGSTLQALAIARLVERHVGVPYRFASVDAVAKFVLAAVVGAVVAPTVALLPIAALYDMPTEKLLANWLTWWQGDACGILIFTPLILAWRAPSPLAWTPRRLVEAAIFATLLMIGAQSVFSQGFARTFLTVPFVVWAAFRFGQREVTSAVAVLCATALWYTLHEQRGPFAALPLHESLVLLLLFTVTLVFTGLVLSAVLAQLDAAVADLESRVRSRTAELEQAKAEAEKASEAKSQFLANMSHELRTPLNSLLILARLLADNKDANLTGKQVKFARTIHDAGVDLLSLINDLLDLARIESGAVKTLHFAPVRVDELREELERTFSQLAQEKGLRFAVLLDPALPAVMRTDAARVKQVVKNLLANAFKFTSQGEVRLDITLHAPGQVAFAVADTGIGIPPDKQEVIFEAFRQADGTTSRKYGGTGLGLSISRELTRLLGGELRLKSVPGVGSVFTLILPLAPPAVSGESGVR